jgi:tetratricopeptide (TPR) repeat protein
MQRSLVAAAMLLFCVQVCAQRLRSEQESTKNSTEQELRAALCDMDKRDYASAQKKLEQVLQTDPGNIYAQKLLASTLANEIKIGEDSAQNSETARRAIEAYQRVSNNPKTSAAEKTEIDHFVLSLYRRISADEQRKEIERRVSDSTRTARERSELYAVLASQSWDCAYQITSKQTSPEKAEIERAANCVSKGLDYANQAIALDGENESAWSYKANLLREAAKLAGLANNQTQKTSYQQQAEETDKQVTELADKRRVNEEKDSAREDEERKKSDNFTVNDAERMSQELTGYKAGISLDEAVKRAFGPGETELTNLVAPVPIPEEKSQRTATTESKPPEEGCFREADGTASVQEKRNWKTFSPDEDLIVDLPDNVCARGNSYLAASEGVMYVIDSMPRPAIAMRPTVVDGALNTLARVFVSFRSSGWLDEGLANTFEVKLLRKDAVNGQPRRLYGYTRASCSERKESVLLLQASKSHYYTIDISGANESDARIQRFLNSVKFK